MNIKNCLAVGVILLFIGVAFGPSINATIRKEMVEITTEVCGLNGGTQTIQLTNEQVEEVEVLFYSIREQLNATETREDAEEIFREAVVELDRYGLLGGLSVEQAQKLVTGEYQNPGMIKSIENMINRGQEDNTSNVCCLVAGKTDNTLFVSPRMRFFYPILDHWVFGGSYPLMELILEFANDQVKFLALLIFTTLRIMDIQWVEYVLVLYQENPLPRRCMMYLGNDLSEDIPASGWINTYGINGKIGWEGDFYGTLPWGCFLIYKWCPAVDGFRGFQLYIDKFQQEHFYLGSARWVKIESYVT